MAERSDASRQDAAVRAACETLDLNVPCQCRDAVIRAYREMRARGGSESDAHVVAARIYCYHHPEVPLDQANVLVARLTALDMLH